MKILCGESKNTTYEIKKWVTLFTIKYTIYKENVKVCLKHTRDRTWHVHAWIISHSWHRLIIMWSSYLQTLSFEINAIKRHRLRSFIYGSELYSREKRIRKCHRCLQIITKYNLHNIYITIDNIYTWNSIKKIISFVISYTSKNAKFLSKLI